MEMTGIVIWKYLYSSKEWRRGNRSSILDKSYWCSHNKGYLFFLLYQSICKYIYFGHLCIYWNVFTYVSCKTGKQVQLVNPAKLPERPPTACLYSIVLIIPIKWLVLLSFSVTKTRWYCLYINSSIWIPHAGCSYFFFAKNISIGEKMMPQSQSISGAICLLT